MDNYCVYEHKNKINGKCYIGISSNISRRWRNKGIAYKDSKKFWSAIRKYGWDTFEHNVIVSDISKEAACVLEKHLIEALKSNHPDKGYNIHEGGNTPPVHYGKDNPFYDNHSMSGENHPMYGKKHTKETRLKMSANHSDVSREKNPFWNDHRFQGGNHPNAVPVICIETNKRYPCMMDAEKETGVARQSIRKAINGVLKTAGGYHWKDA